MAISATVFNRRKDEAAVVPSNKIARLGMTVCFLATTGLLIAGLTRSPPSAAPGAHPPQAGAITADLHGPRTK
jgi:hypothetical protein